jgi:antitoxin MazE
MIGKMPMERIHRKVTKIGDSLGVTFSTDFLEKLNLDIGDDVEIM